MVSSDVWWFCVQFYEADEQHRRQEAQLKARLEQLEKESEQHQAVVDGLTSKYMETIERLQSDKARLEVRGRKERVGVRVV